MKINSIEPIEGTQRIVIRSDRTFAVYEVPSFELVYYHGAKATDQITRARISQDGQVALLFAHNFAETFTLQRVDEVQKTICEEEQCILYSGDIDHERKLVAAGTVFRVLIVWNLETGAIIHRLRGHTGVIFDTLFLKGLSGTVCIGSVSDDRSIRIWQDDAQVAEIYGHTQRVWKLAQLGVSSQDINEGSISIASSSEDATCKLWQVKFGSSQSWREITTLKGHLGKNVRALSAYGRCVVTGGEDGSVKLWHVDQLAVQEQGDEVDAVEEIRTRVPMPGCVEVPALVATEEGDGGATKLTDKQKKLVNQIKCIQIVAGLAVIAATTKGTLRRYPLTTEKAIFDRSGVTLYQDEEQSLITDFAATKDASYAVLAIGNGEISVLKLNGSTTADVLLRAKLCDIRLLSCFIVEEKADSFDILGANGRAELVKATFNTVIQEMQEQVVFKADQKVQFTATQVIQSRRLVAGDSRGHLWLFDYQSGEKLAVVKSHPDRITGLSLMADSSVIACSKDSFLNVFTIEADRLAKQQAIKSSSLNIIYEVEGPCLLGFNGLHCYIWDRDQDLALIRVNTKGGNRPVRGFYAPLEAGGQKRAIIAYAYGDCLALAFKNGAENEATAQQSAKTDLLPGMHGREIMAVIGLAKGQIILTGSEDTTFKVLRVGGDKARVTVEQTFSQHEASVRAFAKSKIGTGRNLGSLASQTHLIVSAGSKMQAHLFAWSSTSQQLRHLCRYNQQVFKQPKRASKKDFSAQVDTQDFRIMAAAVVSTPDAFYVAFGTSSGHLVLEKVNFDAQGTATLRQVQFMRHDAAMLSLKRVCLPGQDPLLVCGFTNGSVMIYQVRESGLSLRHKSLQVHGFGVNCLDTVVVSDTRFLTVSGGDDQNIAVCLFEITDTSTSKLSQVRQYAHSSCIKGVFATQRDGKVTVGSSGYDQRFKTWTVSIDGGNQVKIERVDSHRHCLSDMNGICHVSGKAFLVGQGLQSFTI